MGYILKQNKAISISVLKALDHFVEAIAHSEADLWERLKLIFGLGFTTISFGASLRGSEGLKLDFETLIRYIRKGDIPRSKSTALVPGHVTIPLKGRFKGEQGERCHLLPLRNYTS